MNYVHIYELIIIQKWEALVVKSKLLDMAHMMVMDFFDPSHQVKGQKQ